MLSVVPGCVSVVLCDLIRFSFHFPLMTNDRQLAALSPLIGVYLEQGIFLNPKKFEMYLKPNGARSTKLLGENVIYISRRTQLAPAIRYGCSSSPCHPSTFWTSTTLYAYPLFAAVLQSLSEAAKSITSNATRAFCINIVLYAYSNSHAG